MPTTCGGSKSAERNYCGPGECPIAQCRYLLPAKYDQLLVIEATLDTSYQGGLRITYRILSEDEEQLHATGYTRHAFLNPQGRVIRPPQFMRELINNQISQES